MVWLVFFLFVSSQFCRFFFQVEDASSWEDATDWFRRMIACGLDPGRICASLKTPGFDRDSFVTETRRNVEVTDPTLAVNVSIERNINIWYLCLWYLDE